MRPNRLSRRRTAALHGSSGWPQSRLPEFVQPLNQRQWATLPIVQGVLGAMVLGLMACSTARPPTTPTTEPSANPSLAQLLRDAEHSDRLNAQLYTRSAPSLDHYYNLKADEVNDVISRLQRGEYVPSDDINHALDNSLASTFGVPVN
jgi:hypothetical protein